jgi:hypothetical protein
MTPPLDDVTALLRRELDVVPSPAFVPGVRARVAAEAMARPGWSWRRLVPAAAAVVLCAAAVFLRVPSTTSAPPGPGGPALPTPLAAQPAPGAAAPGGTVPPRIPARRLPRARTDDRTVVIVDAGQRAAIQRYLVMVSEGRVTTDALAGTNVPSLQPVTAAMHPIGVAAVAVSPIPVGGVLPSGTEK